MNTFGESIVKSVKIEAAGSAISNDIAHLKESFPKKLHFLFDPKQHIKHFPIAKVLNNFEFTFSKDLSGEGVIAVEFKVINKGSRDLGIKGLKELENSFSRFTKSLGFKKETEGWAQEIIATLNEGDELPLNIPCYSSGFCIWAGIASLESAQDRLTIGSSLGIPEDEDYLRLYTFVYYA